MIASNYAEEFKEGSDCSLYERWEVATDEKINILLVDDKPRNLVVLEAILDTLGHNLVRAQSGSEALRCLLRDDFAVILMDAFMPDMDGFETAAAIRGRARSSSTPIIFLTALGRSEMHMFKGYSVGAVDYLVKPVEPDILRSKVTVFVDLFRKTEQVKRQADQLRELERREHERELAQVQQRWEAERLRLSVHLAQHIQRKLFPIAAPNCPGLDIYGASYPAEEMGGDYFDYIPNADDSVTLAIGDVCGHGVGPALLMAATRAYLRALALTHTDVAEILAIANRVLAADVTEERFVTMLLLRLDPRQRSVVYCSAGHPPGYILSASGHVREVLESTAIPLGVRPGESFPSAPTAQLEPGDVVLLLTDGLIETQAADGTRFGTERALDVVRAHQHRSSREIVQALYHTVLEFAELQNHHDDVTAIVTKVL